jgi:glycosyltransferase involved in cell wall biosynthesis
MDEHSVSKSRPAKILQLQLNFDVATRHVGEEISQALLEADHDVTTAYLSGSLMPGMDASSKKIHCFNFSKKTLKGISRWYSIWKLYRYIKENKFSMVIAHRFKAIHMLLLLDRFINVPVVGVIHGLGDYDRKYRQKIIRLLVSKNSSFVAVSEEVKQYMLDLSCGFSQANTLAITNAIDIKRTQERQLSRLEAQEALGISSEAFVIGAIGRLVPVKGYEYVINAVSLLGSTKKEIQLVIIGDGRLRTELQAMIIERGLQEKISLVGWKDQAEIYVRAFDVFIMSSLSEGMPLALMEAFSGKVPAIASDIPSLRGLIDGSGGWTFPPANEIELASVLKEVLNVGEDDLKKKGQLAYTYILNKHSIEEFGDSYRALACSKLALHSENNRTPSNV